MSSKALASGIFTDSFEWSIFEIPSYKKKELEQIFQGVKLEKTVYIIHLWQKSENSMSSWYEASDNERTKLGEKFLSFAAKICNELKKEGYWADLIDPFSGSPFIGSRGNTAFQEIDYMELLGYSVIDLNCCKAVDYKSWGFNSLAGNMLSLAPPKVIEEILSKIWKENKV